MKKFAVLLSALAVTGLTACGSPAAKQETRQAQGVASPAAGGDGPAADIIVSSLQPAPTAAPTSSSAPTAVAKPGPGAAEPRPTTTTATLPPPALTNTTTVPAPAPTATTPPVPAAPAPVVVTPPSAPTSTTTAPKPTFPDRTPCNDGAADLRDTQSEYLAGANSLDEMRSRMAGWAASYNSALYAYASCVAKGGAIDARHNDFNGGTGDGEYCGPKPTTASSTAFSAALTAQSGCWDSIYDRIDSGEYRR